MTRSRSLLAVTACALALAGCGGSHSRPTTPGATRRASTAPSITSRGEQAAASLSAAAYVRFLNGRNTPSGLPDATSSVRALATRAGAIPAARRRGALVMSALRQAVGAGAGYLLTARDDTHAFYVQLTLAEQRRRWLVAELTPPDFVQVFAPRGPPLPAPTPGSAAPENAARLFLRGYLPWLYGQAPLHAINVASSELLASLRMHMPRVPPTMQALRPKVAAIAMQHHGRGWQALSNISDGHETYELVLTVAQTRNRWLVSNVSFPR